MQYVKLSIRSALLVPLLVSGAGFAVAIPAAAQNTAQSHTVPSQQANAHLRVARFWRGEGVTLLEGVIGAPVGAGNTASPLVRLTISDSDGKVLLSDTMTHTVTPQLLQVAQSRSDIELSSPVTVRVRPGTYTVNVAVTRGTTVDSARTTVAAFAEAPLISDVIVSNSIRALAAGEQASNVEAAMGRFAIVRSARPALQMAEPNLWYYLELYTPAGAAGSNAELEFSVRRATGGNPLFSTKRNLALTERGGADAARLTLAGLPPGEYVLSVTAQVGARRETREAPFAMASFEAEPVAAPVATAGNEEQTYQTYFAPTVRTDTDVAQLVDALTVVSLGEAVPEYTAQLDSEAKRRFLARYFARIPDPNPATAEHDLLQEYSARATYAAREFQERDLKRSGLRTERGRIYLKYGAPDAKQVFPISGSRGAVEIWRYSRQRGLKYAFLDDTGFQHYTMIYTTDPTMQSLPDWQERVRDREVIQQILSF